MAGRRAAGSRVDKRNYQKKCPEKGQAIEKNYCSPILADYWAVMSLQASSLGLKTGDRFA